MSDQEFYSPEEMAALHNVDPMTIYRALQLDQKRDEAARRIPGAVKEGSKYRGQWKIPRAAAQNWKRDGRGRKSK